MTITQLESVIIQIHWHELNILDIIIHLWDQLGGKNVFIPYSPK